MTAERAKTLLYNALDYMQSECDIEVTAEFVDEELGMTPEEYMEYAKEVDMIEEQHDDDIRTD